ncbi:MAG: hypothetical protein QNJ47_09950 [Nostocaceae cyanobacterium]|nr:hypothetical protein [Nostocaceae cyanobacterium]
MFMHIIFRDKWKSPGHSEDKKFDDFHREIKPKILKAAKKIQKYSHRVGENPDIKVDKDGSIVLVGSKRGKYKGKQLPTSLHVEDFGFVLCFTQLDSSYTEVSLFFIQAIQQDFTIYGENLETDFICFDRVYWIPEDEEILDKLIEYILATHSEMNFRVLIGFIPDRDLSNE